MRSLLMSTTGPDGLTSDSNDRLYNKAGLLRGDRRAPRRYPGSVVGRTKPGIHKRLGSAGFSVEEIAVRANGSRGGSRHWIWLAHITMILD